MCLVGLVVVTAELTHGPCPARPISAAGGPLQDHCRSLCLAHPPQSPALLSSTFLWPLNLQGSPVPTPLHNLFFQTVTQLWKFLNITHLPTCIQMFIGNHQCGSCCAKHWQKDISAHTFNALKMLTIWNPGFQP